VRDCHTATTVVGGPVWCLNLIWADPQTKKFIEPPEQIKREIAALKADKSVPEAEKKEDLAQLEAALKSAPRMLHDLQDCAKRGVPIVVFNPSRERGHERFTNPQNPAEMLVKPATQISSQYHQITVGGDKAMSG